MIVNRDSNTLKQINDMGQRRVVEAEEETMWRMKDSGVQRHDHDVERSTDERKREPQSHMLRYLEETCLLGICRWNMTTKEEKSIKQNKIDIHKIKKNTQ